jgi:hypothetical protein
MKKTNRSEAVKLGLGGLLLLGVLVPLFAASSSFTCNVSQGFNFEKDSQELIGHINYLKIGDIEMKSDLNVTDPANIKNSVKVFGIASGIHWNGGYAEPVTFACQVSVENKNKLATLQHKAMANTKVEFQFDIYDYDPKAKKYYKCFHSNGKKLKGLVLKQGGELAMNIAMDQSSEVVSPKNHTLQLGVMPQDQAQEIHLAFSTTNKLVKAWGVAVSALRERARTLLARIH